MSHASSWLRARASVPALAQLTQGQLACTVPPASPLLNWWLVAGDPGFRGEGLGLQARQGVEGETLRERGRRKVNCTVGESGEHWVPKRQPLWGVEVGHQCVGDAALQKPEVWF